MPKHETDEEAMLFVADRLLKRARSTGLSSDQVKIVEELEGKLLRVQGVALVEQCERIVAWLGKDFADLTAFRQDMKELGQHMRKFNLYLKSRKMAGDR